MRDYAGYIRLLSKILSVDASDILQLQSDDLTKIDRTMEASGNRYKRILSRRFGLYDGDEQTLRTIAKEFHVSPARIRQLEAKAMSKLRHPHRIRNFLRLTKTGLERLKRMEETPLLETDVAYFEPSTRTLNALNAAGVRTVGELVRKTEREMLKIRGFGRKSLAELKNLLHELGLDFAPD